MNSADEVLLILIGFGGLLVAAGLWLILPVASWMRVSRVKRELADVQARLAALESAEASRLAARCLGQWLRPRLPAWPPTSPQTDTAPQEPIPAPSIIQPPIVPPPYVQVPPVVVTPPVPSPSVDREPAGPAAAQDDESTSLEDAIGGRLMLWVGAIVLVLGVAFFLKYAFDNEWITESMRVAMGVAGRCGADRCGPAIRQRGYSAYGQIVTGGGLAVLFLAIYAAFSFYDLIGRTTTFALLVMVTAGAAALADRQRALGLALMAVGGGFATPFLVGSGAGRAAHALHVTTRCWSSARSTLPTDRAGPA